jgi:hypothetical protein
MRIVPTASGSQPAAPKAAGGSRPSTRSFTAILDERGGPGPRTPTAAERPAVAPAPARAAGAPHSPLRTMLERAVGNEKQIDALLDAAARGKTFKPGELLAMQATVARYSQTVEVVSRVADRLVGAVKQTMGTQV